MSEFTYQIYVNEEHNLVYLVVEGVIDKNQGRRVILETRAKAAETGLNIFSDMRNSETIARPADWFFLFRDKEIYPSNPDEKTAVLIKPEMAGMYGFVENVTRNLRMQIQVFFDKDEALAWLKSGE